MIVCARGCTWPKLHQPGCLHSGDVCPGCLPTEADIGRWCERCARTVRIWLADLPSLAFEVAGLPDGRLNYGKGQVSDAPRAPSKEPASPAPAFDAGEEAARWLWSWTDMVCDSTRPRMAGPARYTVVGTPRLDPDACSAFLRAHLSWPAEHEPVQFYDELRQLVGSLERAMGADEVVEQIKDPCPRCDLWMLTREDGAGSVVCGNVDCGAVYRLAEWDRMKEEATAS